MGRAGGRESENLEVVGYNPLLRQYLDLGDLLQELLEAIKFLILSSRLSPFPRIMETEMMTV